MKCCNQNMIDVSQGYGQLDNEYYETSSCLVCGKIIQHIERFADEEELEQIREDYENEKN